MRRAIALALLVASCRRSDPMPASGGPAPPGPSGSGAVAEPLPRCRAARDLPIAGEEVVAGEAVVARDAVLVGLVRRDGGKRVASVLRASLDLASSRVVDVGLALGDDPPPVPYARVADTFVALYGRRMDPLDAGLGTPLATRELRLASLDGKTLGSVVQQADESTAFGVAWPSAGEGPPLVAWDEDAPIAVGQFLADRGTVKVQLLGSSAKPRSVSPYATDAEQPRLAPREGGFWIGWVARRDAAGPDSGAWAPEGPGESRAMRWVEIAALDANGELAGPIRRVSPEKGRVVSFELAPSGGAADLAVLVQDEMARGEGGGARILRYAVTAERVEPSDIVGDGVGHAIAELLPGEPDGGARWLAWVDASERAHLLPLGPGLAPRAGASTERALDRARVVAAAGRALYAIVSEGGEGGGRLTLRRLACD